MTSYLNKEKANYENMCLAIKRTNDKDPKMAGTSAELPTYFRGHYLLENANIRKLEHPGIRRAAGKETYQAIYDALKSSYTDDLMKEHDRAYSSSFSGKGARTHAEEEQWDEEEFGEEGDDEEDWDDCGEDYAEEGDEEEADDWDAICAFDDEGYTYATEKGVDALDDQAAEGDAEYEQALLDFRQSRDVLAKARIARGFYPVVVPAGFAPDKVAARNSPSSGKKGGKKKGKGRGRGKGRGGGRKGSARGARKKPAASTGAADRPKPTPGLRAKKASGKGGGGVKRPINGTCFRCGAPDHMAYDCPNQGSAPSNKKERHMLEGEYLQFDWFDDDDLGAEEDVGEHTCFHRDMVLASFLEGIRGYAILDPGATRCTIPSLTLTYVMEDLTETGDIDHHHGWHCATEIQRRFGVANGSSHRALMEVQYKHPIGPLRGKQLNWNVMPDEQSCEAPLLGMDFLSAHKAVVDMEEGTIYFKDDPRFFYNMRRAPNGHWLVPLTREAVEECGKQSIGKMSKKEAAHKVPLT